MRLNQMRHTEAYQLSPAHLHTHLILLPESCSVRTSSLFPEPSSVRGPSMFLHHAQWTINFHAGLLHP